jgi:hypothetical protein
MIRCEECGCTSGSAHGWVAFIAFDPDDPDDERVTVVYCPPCADEQFEVQGDVAATYT